MRFFLILGETTLEASSTIPDSRIFLILAYGKPAHNPPKLRYEECLYDEQLTERCLPQLGGAAA